MQSCLFSNPGISRFVRLNLGSLANITGRPASIAFTQWSKKREHCPNKCDIWHKVPNFMFIWAEAWEYSPQNCQNSEGRKSVMFFLVLFFLSRFGMTKFVIMETIWCSVIFKTIMVSLHRGRFVVVHLCSSFPIDPHVYRGENVWIQLPKLSKFTILARNLYLRGDSFAIFFTKFSAFVRVYR